MEVFWDVKERERQEEASLKKALEILEASILLSKRAVAIRNAPGFSAMVDQLRKLHSAAMSKLATDMTLTNDSIREQRGRVSALADLISLLTNEQSTDLLEARMAQVQNDLDDALRRRPKQQKQEATPS